MTQQSTRRTTSPAARWRSTKSRKNKHILTRKSEFFFLVSQFSHYYKFLKKVTSQNNAGPSQSQNSYPSQQMQSYSRPMPKEVITMQNPIQSTAMPSSSNYQAMNRLSKSRQSIDSKINQYSVDQYKRSGSRNAMKDSRTEEESGAMGSKFLYNVILNNSKSKGKLAAYRSRKELLN